MRKALTRMPRPTERRQYMHVAARQPTATASSASSTTASAKCSAEANPLVVSIIGWWYIGANVGHIASKFIAELAIEGVCPDRGRVATDAALRKCKDSDKMLVSDRSKAQVTFGRRVGVARAMQCVEPPACSVVQCGGSTSVLFHTLVVLSEL